MTKNENVIQIHCTVKNDVKSPISLKKGLLLSHQRNCSCFKNQAKYGNTENKKKKKRMIKMVHLWLMHAH